MKKVLTIAGSDSGGCAGIQADIKAISACGCFGMSVITAITAQNTLGVTDIEDISIKSIKAQIDAVLSDIGADSIKTGMLASSEIINCIADKIREYNIKNFILDPVMVSTTGAKLLQNNAIDTLIKKLIPLSLIITPNIHEAELLTGIKINNQDSIDKACKEIFKMGTQNVLIKGGHIDSDKATDTLYDGKNFREYSSVKIDTKNLHGTGCSYASSIAAFIAKGESVDKAVSMAKQYITSAITHGKELNIGNGAGPVNHFYNIK